MHIFKGIVNNCLCKNNNFIELPNHKIFANAITISNKLRNTIINNPINYTKSTFQIIRKYLTNTSKSLTCYDQTLIRVYVCI